MCPLSDDGHFGLQWIGVFKAVNCNRKTMNIWNVQHHVSCCRFNGSGLTKSKLSYWAAFSSMASRIWSLLYSIASWQRNRPRKNHGKDLNPAGEELSIWVCLARAPRNSKDSHRFFPYIINCHFRAYSVFPVLRHSHLKGDNMYNMREGRRRSSGINLGDR